MKYKAFISYSHSADDALAPALQSALHAFARPWSRMRALHVFRDQTSLAASPELWPSIEAALGASEYLLLLASPASAASRWVGREIEWWFEHRSPRTMLILLTEGELAWDDAAGDFDWTRTSSLPRALVSGRFPVEPLWVDLRWAKSVATLSLRHDRFRRAVLDIAAPLHGKDKDELDGDDVRQFARLQRIRRAVIAGLAMLTIAAVAAAIVAMRQRDEANRQNAIAQAGRLAAQADLLREQGGAIDASVMLATEGLRILSSIGSRSFEIDLSLRRALESMPRQLGDLNVTADEIRLTPAADHVITEHAGQMAVLQLPGGALRSCSRSEIEAKTKAEGSSTIRLITAASTNGDWCIMQQFDSDQRMTLELWSARPLQRADRIQILSKAGHLRPAISEDGDLIAMTDRSQMGQVAESTLRLWSRSRDRELLRLEGVEFRGFSPDRRHFATTDGLWRLPDSASPRPQRVITWRGEPWHLAFSRSGARVAVRASHDGELDLWDVNASTVLRTSTPPVGAVLALRDDGRFIVVGGAEKTVLADTESGDVHATIPLEATAAAFGTRDPTLVVTEVNRFGLTRTRLVGLPASGTALVGSEIPPGARAHRIGLGRDRVDLLVTTDDALRIVRWAFGSGNWSDVLTLPSPQHLAVSADGEHFAAAIDSKVVVGRTDASQPPVEIVQAAPPMLVALSRNGRYLATFAAGAMQVWQPGSSEHWTTTLPGPPGAMHVSGDGTFGFALLVDDSQPSRIGPLHTLVRWRLATPADAVSVSLGRLQRPLSSTCMVSDDGRYVRAGGVRHDFSAAAAASLQVTPEDLSECDAAITAPLRLAVDGTQLAVSDRGTGEPLARLDHGGPVLLSAASPDGRRVATVDGSGGVQLFTLDPAELVAQACDRGPRPLSAEEWGRFLSPAIQRDACGRTRPEPEAR